MDSGFKYKVALIGFGAAGRIFHAPFIACTENLELSAIVTADSVRAAQAREEYPDARILASASDVFKASADYDLVVVAAPNKHHYTLAKSALDAGCPVVVDKPLAASSRQIRELIDLSHKQQKFLTVFQNRRFDGDFLTLRSIIDKNMLGRIIRFESRFERFRPNPKADAWRESADPAEAGGLLYDLGSHLIDQACVLFGEPHSVYAEVNTVRPSAQVDDDVFLALTFKNDVVAHIWANVISRIPGPRFALMGLNGTFEKYGLDPQEDTLKAGGRPGNAGWGQDSESDWGDIHTTIDGLEVCEKLKSEDGAYQLFYSNISHVLAGHK